MKKKETGKLSTKYCPKLADRVVVMTARDENGFQRHTCLSSHLCHSEDRMTCQHDTPKDSPTM